MFSIERQFATPVVEKSMNVHICGKKTSMLGDCFAVKEFVLCFQYMITGSVIHLLICSKPVYYNNA
jgi:hypothetical protein